jgi:pimeloyl-[acyl-carrier protein] methyl ester esterase
MKIPDLVLLPGLDGTGSLFRRLLAALPGDLQTKVVSYPNQALDLDQLAAHVVRQLPSQRIVLLAESFSGLVALTLLANAASRVRAVIFVGAFGEPPRPFLLRFAPLASQAGGWVRSIPAFFLRRYCLGPEASAEELNELRQAITAVAPGVLAQRLALVAKRHSFGTLPSDVPASCATWFEQRFKPCEIEEVRGPHFLLQAKPRDCAAVITRMLQTLAC